MTSVFHRFSVGLVVGLAVLATPGFAEQSRLPQDEVILVKASCADLRQEVRALHPECAPVRRANAFGLLRPVLVAEIREARRPNQAAPRKLIKMPWVIGVFQ